MYESSPGRNGEPQNSRTTNHAKDVICDPNFEGWFRSRSAHLAQAPGAAGRLHRVSLSLFYKTDRIPSFDIRPARNALKPVRGKFNTLIQSQRLCECNAQCMAGGPARNAL